MKNLLHIGLTSNSSYVFVLYANTNTSEKLRNNVVVFDWDGNCKARINIDSNNWIVSPFIGEDRFLYWIENDAVGESSPKYINVI